jgi:hypothetical protein
MRVMGYSPGPLPPAASTATAHVRRPSLETSIVSFAGSGWLPFCGYPQGCGPNPCTRSTPLASYMPLGESRLIREAGFVSVEPLVSSNARSTPTIATRRTIAAATGNPRISSRTASSSRNTAESAAPCNIANVPNTSSIAAFNVAELRVLAICELPRANSTLYWSSYFIEPAMFRALCWLFIFASRILSIGLVSRQSRWSVQVLDGRIPGGTRDVAYPFDNGRIANRPQGVAVRFLTCVGGGSRGFLDADTSSAILTKFGDDCTLGDTIDLKPALPPAQERPDAGQGGSPPRAARRDDGPCLDDSRPRPRCCGG